MWAIDRELKATPSLVTEGSIAENFLDWTIQIRDDVQFHKRYGLMTMDDITYSYKEYHEGALNARATILGDAWLVNQGGSQEIIDDITIKINTGNPWVLEVAYEAMRTSSGASTSVVSESTFSYGTEHPWLQEHVTDAKAEVNPVELARKEIEVYGWFSDNVMGFGLYAFDGTWPVGPKLDPIWEPIDFRDIRTPEGFE